VRNRPETIARVSPIVWLPIFLLIADYLEGFI
jgi:hypothetical protein